jgi:hypothetical protein
MIAKISRWNENQFNFLKCYHQYNFNHDFLIVSWMRHSAEEDIYFLLDRSNRRTYILFTNPLSHFFTCTRSLNLASVHLSFSLSNTHSHLGEPAMRILSPLDKVIKLKSKKSVWAKVKEIIGKTRKKDRQWAKRKKKQRQTKLE